MREERTLKPTLHTVYRNIRVIKQATIKQYLIVANTWQHMQHFRIVDTLLKLPLRPFPVAQLRATASASASASPEPLGAILSYPVCVHLTISRTVRASCTAPCPAPHPCSAVCSVQQSG